MLTGSDEFQASSKELEDELERELSATEKQQTELKEKIKRLETEKDEWKVCSWSKLSVTSGSERTDRVG